MYGVGDVEFSPLDEYRRLAEVNLFGLVRVTKKFIPLIRKSKGNIQIYNDMVFLLYRGI